MGALFLLRQSALLVFCLTKHFLLADKPSFTIHGAYTSLVYIRSMIGGCLADRYLGAWKAVLAGGIFIAAGHIEPGYHPTERA